MLSIEINDSVINESHLTNPDKQGIDETQVIENKPAIRKAYNSVSIFNGTALPSITQSNNKPELEMPKSNSEMDSSSIAETDEMLKKILKQFKDLMTEVESIFAKYSFVSSGEFAAAMSAVIAELGGEQIDLKLIELQTLKAKNENLMKENQEKIDKADDAAKEAKKSNTVNTIIGVLGAIIGAILAPLTGGVFGVLLGAASCAGFCSAIVNNDAVKSTMDKSTADTVAKVFMGLEFATMIASVLAGGAGLIAGKLASSARPFFQKVAQKLQQSTTLTEGTKMFANTTNAISGASTGASETVSSVMEAKVLYAEADIRDTRADLELLQNLQDRLRGQLKTIMEQYESMMEAILRMISQSGDSLQELLKRRAMV